MVRLQRRSLLLPAASTLLLALQLLAAGPGCAAPSLIGRKRSDSHLRYFSFYSHGEVLAEQRGIVNVRLGHDAHYDPARSWWTRAASGDLATNFSDAVAGYKRFGMSSFLDVEELVWNRSLYPAVPAFLASDYEVSVRAVVSAASPLLRSGVIRGLFLGDELCCTGTAPDALAALASFCRAQLLAAGHGNAEVYINECARSFIGAGESGGEPWPGWNKGMIPAGLTLVSLDNYALANATDMRTHRVTPWWEAEVDKVRKLYQLAFRGRLHPHQRLLVVPGLYGNDSATAAEHALHDQQLVKKIELYWDWIQNDTNIIGMCPYHWQDTPDPPQPGSGPVQCYDPDKLPGNCGHVGELFGLGAKNYPALIAKLRDIGKTFPQY